MLAPAPGKTGEFQEAEAGKWFTYQPTNDSWALAHGLTHEIDVLDGVRFAKVLKSRAHVCVDEAGDGAPVLQTWILKNHTSYVSH